MGPCELRLLRRGVPPVELRFERRDVGDDILPAVRRSELQNGSKMFDVKFNEGAGTTRGKNDASRLPLSR
jgi:hypothetical protein